MDAIRRDFLKIAGAGLTGFAVPAVVGAAPKAPTVAKDAAGGNMFDVRKYGAVADGKTIDSPAINKAIEAAAAVGGGTVYFPAGVYASYSIRLKSNIVLYLEQGATLLGANTSLTGTTSGYDPAEPNDPWESYQDYGHNHWHNSLIWGEGINNFAIVGTGLIWGKGLSRGGAEKEKPKAETPGCRE